MEITLTESEKQQVMEDVHAIRDGIEQLTAALAGIGSMFGGGEPGKLPGGFFGGGSPGG